MSTTRDQLAKIIRKHADGDYGAEKAADVVHVEEGVAAIIAENVVIKRADLPKVVDTGVNLRVEGHCFSGISATDLRQRALAHLAAAEHLDAREAREAEAAKEAELTARRDALVTELGEKAYGANVAREYPLLTPVAQAAIDRIIEAEDKLAECEKRSRTLAPTPDFSARHSWEDQPDEVL